MQDWFVKIIRNIILRALDLGNAPSAAEIEEKLASLSSGETIASSPRISVVDAGAQNDPVVFSIRGQVPFAAGADSAQMRLEIAVDKSVEDGALQIVDWKTVSGELILAKPGVFDAQVALQYKEGIWTGAGDLLILPNLPGLSVGLVIGALNGSGAVISIDADLPVPVPLGITGLGLGGIGGSFAYNFVPALASPSPTAEDIVNWAQEMEDTDADDDIVYWLEAPPSQTAIGVGINADLVTMADGGRAMRMDGVGLAVFTPGPAFLLGGKGYLVGLENSANIEGYLSVDIPTASMSLGFGVDVRILPMNSFRLFEQTGVIDAYFSFLDPAAWYINYGTPEQPMKGKVMQSALFDSGVPADIFFMVNNNRMHFGADISLGWNKDFKVVRVIAQLGAEIQAFLGWNPVQLQALFSISGELGIKVWKFDFLLSASATVTGHLPDPAFLQVELEAKVNLPWPIPDPKPVKIPITFGKEPELGPPLAPAMLVGTSIVGGTAAESSMEFGAIHEITGRQWSLSNPKAGAGKAWPDLVLVAPFNITPKDETDTVSTPASGTAVEGGYTVQHKINRMELRDLEADEVVPIEQAVWAKGAGNEDTARLHILGNDPYSWLMAHNEVDSIGFGYEQSVKEQYFMTGEEEVFEGERSFAEIVIEPEGEAALLTSFQPMLETRVLRSEEFTLKFRNFDGEPFRVDQVELLLISANPSFPALDLQSNAQVSSILYGTWTLWRVQLAVDEPTDAIPIGSPIEGEPLLVYGVRYRYAPTVISHCTEKPILIPGRYRIGIEGTTTATHLELPNSDDVTWEVEQEFEVDFPETIRPYIKYSTIGDRRLFGKDQAEWNPTMYGVGFPFYQKYHMIIWLLVSYMSKIFPSVKLRLRYESGEELVFEESPSANSDGTSSLPQASQDWMEAAGCSAPPDQIVDIGECLTEAGMATFSISFDHPELGEQVLDEWGCYISRFDNFREHIGLECPSILTIYSKDKITEINCCPTIFDPVGPGDFTQRMSGNRIDNFFTATPPEKNKPNPDLPLLGGEYPQNALGPATVGGLGFPTVDWYLPDYIVENIDELDATSGARFARFAQDTGAQFGDEDNFLHAINQTVDQTTVEAVVDSYERPYALWIRTPEPVDWRRVTATLTIRHVVQNDDCPTTYADRPALVMEVAIIPSPDGSSAFLVGNPILDGSGGWVLPGSPIYTFLPRGEFELEFEYDLDKVGLPKLRRVGSDSPAELVTLRFIQPFGLDWPDEDSTINFSAIGLELLATHYNIPATTLYQAFAGNLEPGTLNPLSADEDGMNRTNQESPANVGNVDRARGKSTTSKNKGAK